MPERDWNAITTTVKDNISTNPTNTQAGVVGPINQELSQIYGNWRDVLKKRTEDEFNKFYRAEQNDRGETYYVPNYDYNPKGNKNIVERGKYLARQWGIPESEINKYNESKK